MNKLSNALFTSAGSTSISWIATGLQTAATFQYIQLVLSIIGSAITVLIGIYGLVQIIIKIVKKIKNNEPIQNEDVKDVTNQVENIADNISDIIEHLTHSSEDEVPNKKE